jgi:hypothetical protein
MPDMADKAEERLLQEWRSAQREAPRKGTKKALRCAA